MVLNVVFVDNRVLQGSCSSVISSLDQLKFCAEKFCAKFNSQPLMLVETGDDKGCILSYFTDPYSKIEDSIKAIKPYRAANCSLSVSLSIVFTIMNKYRIRNGTDRFGFGRSPWYISNYMNFLI